MISDPPQRTTDAGKRSRETQGILREISPYLTLGIQLAAVIVVFFFVGEWVDRRWGIDPIGKLVGAMIGMIGGFAKFFKSVASLIATQEHKQTDEKREN